jgi:integrase
MATIESYETSTGAKRYTVRYRTPQRTQTKKRGFTTMRAAREFAATVEVRKLTGAYVNPSAGKVVFGELAESWLAGKVNLAASTRARYRSALDVHLLPAFGSAPLCDVTPERLRRWVAGAAASSAAATVRKNHTVLHQVLAQAVADGRLAVNPAAELELPAIDETEKRYLTAGQIRALADAAGEHGALVLLLGFTGLRFGEAAALTVADIDLVHGRVRVHRSVTAVGGTMVFSAPKSHQARTVALPRFLVDVLREHLAAGRDPDALAFPDSRGGPMRLHNVRRGWWCRAVAESGVPAGLCPHELRHSAASMAISAGASIKAVQKMLGHKSATLTLDRYGHLYADELQGVADRLDSLHAAAADFSECAQNVPTRLRVVRQLPGSGPLTCGYVVEPRGIEPLTPALQRQCSTN